MLIKTLKIAEIKENDYNPRVKLEKDTKEYRKISESIRTFGFIEPLVVNAYNMHCVGGHQRLQILKDAGKTEVECVVIHEPDLEREKALCIALNKIKGDWDIEKLSYLLKEENISSFFTGFEQSEIEKYLEGVKETDLLQETEETEEKEEKEEKEIETVVKIGDFSFTITSSEYYALLEDIRKKGIFYSEEIKEELKRRICNDFLGTD